MSVTVTITGKAEGHVHWDADTRTLHTHYSSGTPFTGRDGWLRERAGSFLRPELDLSKSRRSGTVAWRLGDVDAGTLVGRITGRDFRVVVTRDDA